MIPSPELDVTVRARRIACVLDPALLLAAPHALLLAQQLSRTVDLWVCPAFWRLLDASEFFARRPVRLREWLSLDDDRPAEAVGAALLSWSRWRASRDLASLGLYWVGDHQTESFLPEHGPRAVPARFEALVEPWARAAEGEGGAGGATDGPPHPPGEAAVRLAGSLDEPDDGGELATEVNEQVCVASARRCDGALEAACLSVALQAPVLTLAPTRDGEPPLVRQWMGSGLPALAWRSVRPDCAAAEHERWWSAMTASGAQATVTAASSAGLRLGVAQVVAPAEQCVGDGAGEPWATDLDEDDWRGESLVPPPRGAADAAAAGWWRQALALWMPL